MHRQHQLGKRRTALTAAGVFCLSRAIAYLPEIRSTPVQEPLIAAAGGSEVVFAIYVALWALVGVFCLVSLRSARLLWPMCLTAGMCSLWGTAWLTAWALGAYPMGWQTALTYWGPAVMLVALTALAPKDPEVRR